MLFFRKLIVLTWAPEEKPLWSNVFEFIVALKFVVKHSKSFLYGSLVNDLTFCNFQKQIVSLSQKYIDDLAAQHRSFQVKDGPYAVVKTNFG